VIVLATSIGSTFARLYIEANTRMRLISRKDVVFLMCSFSKTFLTAHITIILLNSGVIATIA